MKKLLSFAVAATALLLGRTEIHAQVGGNILGGGGKTPTVTCGDSSHALNWNNSTKVYGCQAITGSAAAGGSNTQVQYNNVGGISGITGLTSNGTVATFAANALNISGGTSGTSIVNAPATGGGTATLFTGSDTIVGLAATQTLTNKTISGASNTLSAIGLSSLATQAADTVVMNATGGAAVPTAVALVSCSTGSSALTYNTTTHAWGCNTISGSGTVNSGTTGQLAYYAGAGTAVSGVGPGTTTTVLHGNAAGAPSYSAVSLAADVTGTLAVGNGGTGVASAQGNGTKVQLSTGTTTTNDCVKFDANGNTVDAGAACGSGGSVSITSGSNNLVVSPSPITGTGTISTKYPINAQTGTTYTIASTDLGELVTFSNTAAVAVTVPQATSTFGAGASFDVQNLNDGLVTLTPTTSTVNGATTLTVPRNTGCTLVSDGTNWQISQCTAKGRNDIMWNMSGKPAASQQFTLIAARAFILPASLTGSKFFIGTNPTATWTETFYKCPGGTSCSSIGTVAFNTSGVPTVTFSSQVSFAIGDVFEVIAPGSQDATGSDVSNWVPGTLN